MDFITVLGLVAATLTTTAFLPQVIKTWKTKSAKDLSFAMLITFSSGVLLGFIYGIYQNALPIIIANIIIFI